MFTLEITTGSNPFHDGESEHAGPEIARILRKLAERVEDGIPTGDHASLLDDEGNTVGEWAYAAEDTD